MCNKCMDLLRSLTLTDYIYCETCEEYVDFFKYDHNIEDTGHNDCKWRHVTEEELINCKKDCVEDGCIENAECEDNLTFFALTTNGLDDDIGIDIVKARDEDKAIAKMEEAAHNYDNTILMNMKRFNNLIAVVKATQNILNSNLDVKRVYTNIEKEDIAFEYKK